MTTIPPVFCLRACRCPLLAIVPGRFDDIRSSAPCQPLVFHCGVRCLTSLASGTNRVGQWGLGAGCGAWAMQPAVQIGLRRRILGLSEAAQRIKAEGLRNCPFLASLRLLCNPALPPLEFYQPFRYPRPQDASQLDHCAALPPARLKFPLRKKAVILDGKRRALDSPGFKAKVFSRSLTPLELQQWLYPRFRCSSVVMTATKRLTIPAPDPAIAGVTLILNAVTFTDGCRFVGKTPHPPCCSDFGCRAHRSHVGHRGSLLQGKARRL